MTIGRLKWLYHIEPPLIALISSKVKRLILIGPLLVVYFQNMMLIIFWKYTYILQFHEFHCNLYLLNTVRCRYNAVSKILEKHTIFRPLSELWWICWRLSLRFISWPSLQWCMQYLIILNHVITARSWIIQPQMPWSRIHAKVCVVCWDVIIHVCLCDIVLERKREKHTISIISTCQLQRRNMSY